MVAAILTPFPTAKAAAAAAAIPGRGVSRPAVGRAAMVGGRRIGLGGAICGEAVR